MLNSEQLAVAHQIQSGFTASFLDGTTAGLILLIVLMAVTAMPTWIEARRKGRSALCWLGLALALPVIPLLLLWLLPPAHD